MPEEYSININDFTGIHKAMAEKANVNGGKTLDNVEISIFNEILSTFNEKNDTFIMENTIYDKNGKKINYVPLKIAERVSTRISVQQPIEDFEKNVKNFQAIEATKQAAKKIKQIQNKPINIECNFGSKKVKISVKRSSLENYIIKYCSKIEDEKIGRFSKIPEIRKKGIALRTKEESKILLDFNNLINSTINAGKEYGVDPRFILAIIQKEVKFNGLDSSVTGTNGKGYMQLTSIVAADMLGAVEQKGNGEYIYQDKLKTSVYGKEIKELFASRGFNINCSKEKRQAVLEKIKKYLISNKDSDFNIRMGTLLLRYHLKNAKGDIKKAAQNYNTVYDSYGGTVKRIYDNICKTK